MEEMEKSKYRLEVLKKIDELEKEGIFDVDLENDPPFTPIKEGEVDYLRKKLSSKIKSRIADKVSFSYFNKLIKKGQIVICPKDNYESSNSTCYRRHFKGGR
jgi:hypothetical protein